MLAGWKVLAVDVLLAAWKVLFVWGTLTAALMLVDWVVLFVGRPLSVALVLAGGMVLQSINQSINQLYLTRVTRDSTSTE